ncbi:long-chain-fatty-acid-CoA ligase [Tricharina praecox]|uniref:long-chain-fatty-acid-CoA ligase n=1 Tax=Tricharina praecox TaxID=43433 RepID=UPI0022208943|nr:long-chain-fatty-acid-CoA ligase [Tricharina praecox]KAI5846820.1 long-chain-fatty-acid-CoA ligase [Tricharina praecox]
MAEQTHFSPSGTALQRLQQTLAHLRHSHELPRLSVLHGPTSTPLLTLTLGSLLRTQATRFAERPAVTVPWTSTAWTYADLDGEADRLARGLLALGVGHGDRIGIMAGNSAEYVAVFFAVARVGAVLVVLNNTYTTTELDFAVAHTGCKVLFITPTIGRHDNAASLSTQTTPQGTLELVVILRGTYTDFPTYADVITAGQAVESADLKAAEAKTSMHDLVNLQFTSGSTGNPKAAMLSHHNLVNNSLFIGQRMDFTPADILCCPPPLFHCFGLVLGLLACINHGASIVLPSETFDPSAVLTAINSHSCTALHGVPTMFSALLSLPRPAGWRSSLRTGIIAGSPVPAPLMKRLFSELGMREYTSSYGLTEASPTCFNAHTDTRLDLRLRTVGKIMPHISAKVVVSGTTAPVPVGVRGELCIAGYALSGGYFRAPDKTRETFRVHEDGRRWLHTGDEAYFDDEGHCVITGRFKDIVIRGGENIYPAEIEERLVEHPRIEAAAVVGVKDEKYGEAVGCFLQGERTSDEEVRDWCRQRLARFKAPQYVFWVGRGEAVEDWPKTGSGKILKPGLRTAAEEIVNGVRTPVVKDVRPTRRPRDKGGMMA